MIMTMQGQQQSLPNMHVMAPKNKWELSDMMKFAVNSGVPIAVRYPRGEAYDELKDYREPIEMGKSEMLFESDKAMAETAEALSSDVRIVPGLICTGDQFITNREQLNVIKAAYPEGLAVDMESAAIAQVCHLYGVPFVSFRIISDTPGAEEHFEEYLNFWQTMADKSFSLTRLFLNNLC